MPSLFSTENFLNAPQNTDEGRELKLDVSKGTQHLFWEKVMSRA